MDDVPPSPLHEIPYLRLFPWLRLFRCPGSAADPKRLMLAALGLVLMSAGWGALDRVFLGPGRVAPWEAVAPEGGPAVVARVTEPAWRITAPFLAVFDPSARSRVMAHAVLAALWGVVVWALIGGAIARVAVVALTRGERVGLRDATRFAARKVVALLGTPLVPMLGVVVVAVPVAGFGLLYRLPGEAGAVVAGVLAFLPLVGGLILTLIVVGLAAGWPLMPASVAAEAEDGFDAMSRAYAYVHQRPWHYAAYVFIAVAAGCAGLLFVELFARLVVGLSAWALALGGPSESVLAFYSKAIALGASPSRAATAPHDFWLGAVGLLARGWVYSYFCTAAAAVYLLLRRDVDGTPWGTVAYQSRPDPLTEALARPADEPEPASVPSPHAPAARDAGEVTGV